MSWREGVSLCMSDIVSEKEYLSVGIVLSDLGPDSLHLTKKRKKVL